MKSSKYIAIVAVLASGLSLNAFAKDKNETRITLSDSVQVGRTDLKPGNYTLQWDGNGPDVQVKVLNGKNVVATVPAKLAQGKSGYSNAITTRAVGNVNTLDEVDFAGGKQSLVFGEATATESSSGQQ
jgi:autotransporter adhesin